MTPEHDPQAHKLLVDLSARIILAPATCGLPEPEKIKALEAATSTARTFIFERPRPVLRIVR
jgi:hypothetical protein